MKRQRLLFILLCIFVTALSLSGCTLIKYGVNNVPTPIPSATAEPTATPTPPSQPVEVKTTPETTTCYINGEGVRLRAAANTQSDILRTLSHRSEIERLGMEGDWSKVNYNGTVGYVHNDLISTILPTPKPTAKPPIDAPVGILIKKAERKLELWLDGALEGSYDIGLGWTPEGPKLKEGDGKTPEGEYYVCVRNPQSSFYLSLGVSYPNKADAKRGLDDLVIEQRDYDTIARAIDRGQQPPWSTGMGGAIMIHGNGSHRDWTAGCIAVDNDVMDILWEHCDIGTTIIIRP